jgi:RNA polymerase sigma-70 factor (ECF subfamily)
VAGADWAEDSRLVAQILEGDDAAFRALVDREHPLLVRLAKGIVKDPALVEEVVQDAWLSVVRSLESWEARSSLRTWIGRIVLNRAKTVASRASRSVPVPSFDSELDEREDTVDASCFSTLGFWKKSPARWNEENPEALVTQRETRLAIEAAMEGLPPGQRAVVTLRDLEGWSSEETCNVLEISESNQRVLLHRARARIRAALETHFGKR